LVTPPSYGGDGPETCAPFAVKPASEKFEVIDWAEDGGFKVEILAYPKLGGAKDHQTAATVFFAKALFGGEGLFQTKVAGSGICVFESPVPADEVLRVDLKNEALRVDGNFALMRTGSIEFSVERSTKGLLGTLTSGEGLLQTFRGTGSVWLAPTQEIYERLQTGSIATLSAAPRSSSTNTAT
jgi:Mitochondrial biogenesis AIM24